MFWLHFFSFFFFSFLLTLFFVQKIKFSPWKAIVFVFAITLGVGVLSELCQLFVPGRVCEMRDVIVNVWGSLVGIFSGLMVLKALRGFKW